jgi:hypothetical protein
VTALTISTRSRSILRSALSSLLVGALAAPGAALAVRPAGALEAAGSTPAGTTPAGTTPVTGARVAGRSRSCQVRLETTSEEPGAGEASTLTGVLTCEEPEPATGQTISIYEHERGTPGASVIGSATTEAGGAFHFTTEALESDSSFYAVAEDGARSERISLRVLSRVTITGSPEGGPLASAGGHAAASSRPGRTVTFTGTVAPAEVGARVALQRQGTGDEGSWHTIARGHVGAEGEYSITHTFGIPGTVNVRVLVRVHGHLPAISQTLSYTVAHGLGAQQADSSRRPTLTASVSAASVQEGEPVTFSGTLTPSHPGQLVYLERQDPNPLRFHVVGSAPVAEDGSFSIEQSLTGVGTQVFRLAVHAAPASRALASGALSVLVTAAP